MNTVMNDNEIRKIEDVRRFLDGTSGVDFSVNGKAERYAWIENSFNRFRYLKLSKADKVREMGSDLQYCNSTQSQCALYSDTTFSTSAVIRSSSFILVLAAS